ncbi:MAG: hypothetical protein KKF68_02865 [Nanoarchaeota archaeon]|nr:hypothetical protein [Nanoarchaeota archaeon]
MNSKIFTIMLGMILLIGIVSANNVINNTQGIYLPLDVIAGDVFQATLSFEYWDNLQNEDNSPLIIKLNLTSEDQTNYPVWKRDFELNGRIEKSALFGFWTKTVYFNCSEEAPLLINHTIGYLTIEDIPDGVFYCYNEEGDLNLNEHDDVFLNIDSNIALWSGKYYLTAEFFYLEDLIGPEVLILNDSYFDQYFRDGSYVDFEASIQDGSGIADYSSLIITPLGNISFAKESTGTPDIYHFYQTLPLPIPEGDWELKVKAIDTEGNYGEDSTIIKIDKTAPEITLLQPTEGGVYTTSIPVEANVSDEEAGVDKEEVYYRLREIVNGTICPEIGIPLGNYSCIRTDWINLPYNGISETFKTNVSTSELNLTSGEYWFDIKAKDILGNEAFLD